MEVMTLMKILEMSLTDIQDEDIREAWSNLTELEQWHYHSHGCCYHCCDFYDGTVMIDFDEEPCDCNGCKLYALVTKKRTNNNKDEYLLSIREAYDEVYDEVGEWILAGRP